MGFAKCRKLGLYAPETAASDCTLYSRIYGYPDFPND